MNRKEFIKTCGYACLGGTAIGVFLQSCASTSYYAQNKIVNKSITILKSEFTHTVKGKEMQRKYILVKSEKLNFPICVFRFSDQEYSAILMECTHRSCELQNQGDYVMCPCHGSEFSNKGIVQNPPAEQNLKTFLITTDNDHIYIQLS
jgi:nitrite reductase/ring-hydroxylating ferredoxin subunit